MRFLDEFLCWLFRGHQMRWSAWARAGYCERCGAFRFMTRKQWQAAMQAEIAEIIGSPKKGEL